jgi:hypothetical protein
MEVTFLSILGISLFFLLLLAYSFLFANTPLLAQTGNMTSLADKIGVKVTYPQANSAVPVGTLVVNGTSTDTSMTDCKVYIDWNDLKPMQNVTPTGPNGGNDYSEWSFKYTQAYHLITEGPNELTSKVVCLNGNTGNTTTKFNSINVTGIKTNVSTVPSKMPGYSNEANISESNNYKSVNLNGVLPQYNGGSGNSNDNSKKEKNHPAQMQVTSPMEEASTDHINPNITLTDLTKIRDNEADLSDTNVGVEKPPQNIDMNSTKIEIPTTNDKIEKINTNSNDTINLGDSLNSPINMDEVHIAGVGIVGPSGESKSSNSGNIVNKTEPMSDTKIININDSHDDKSNKDTGSKQIDSKDKATKNIKPKKLHKRDTPVPEWDNSDPFRAT